MSIKRKFPPDMKLGSFWLNDVENAKDEVETVNIMLREINRLEGLIGTTSVLTLINVALTLGLLVSVIYLSFQVTPGAIDTTYQRGIGSFIKGVINGK